MLVKVKDFSGQVVEDSYTHLAYKVASMAAEVLPKMHPGSWLMKVPIPGRL